MTNRKQDECAQNNTKTKEESSKIYKLIKVSWDIFSRKNLSLNIDQKGFRELKQYECELINRRLTWLLTSQSLLFAAYGLVFKSNKPNVQELTHAISLFGGIIAGVIMLGIMSSIVASCCLWYEVQSKYPDEPLGVRNKTTLLSWCTDISLPGIFIYTWWYLYRL